MAMNHASEEGEVRGVRILYVTDQASSGGDILLRLCLTPALRQRVGGDVDGYDVTRTLYASTRLQGQQARPRSEIHDSLAWSKPRLPQDTVAHLTEGPPSSPKLNFRSAAVPSADKPVRPAIQFPIGVVRWYRGQTSFSCEGVLPVRATGRAWSMKSRLRPLWKSHTAGTDAGQDWQH